LLLETREEPADSFPRGADHLADFFVRQGHSQMAGLFRHAVPVKPAHQQAGQFFAGRVRKDQVANFAAGGGIVRADVLRHPQGKFAIRAHEAHQIALPQEANLAWLPGFGRSFVGASGNHCSDSNWATDINHAQNQCPAITAGNGKLHPALAPRPWPPEATDAGPKAPGPVLRGSIFLGGCALPLQYSRRHVG
jgi:hypothetical protein